MRAPRPRAPRRPITSTGLVQAFVRRPVGVAEITADGIRLLVIVSVLVAGIGWGPVQVGIFMLALFGALAPRALRIRPSVDISIGVTMLIAAWSNVFDLYTEIVGWDKIVHAALTGAVTILVVTAAQRGGLLPQTGSPRFALVLSGAAVGLAVGSIWEMLEWAGHTFTDAVIFVGYDDTIGDLAADGVGGLIAGLALSLLPHGGFSRATPATERATEREPAGGAR
ncbi:hypothetical protein ASF30_04620 [Leifsonia sp. Leaf264]|nr:hypothetical protein ASF30_04620 [Leifsonia sp. Leaf264]